MNMQCGVHEHMLRGAVSCGKGGVRSVTVFRSLPKGWRPPKLNKRKYHLRSMQL